MNGNEKMTNRQQYDGMNFQERLLAYGEQHQYGKGARASSFRVTLTLAQPVAGYDHIHLDALIQKAVVLDALQGTALPPSALPYAIPLPLEVVWHSPQGYPLYNASSLLPQGEAITGLFWWTRRNDASFSARFTQRRKQGGVWQPDDTAGPYKEYRMALPTTAASVLVGYGVGIAGEVERLLSLLTCGVGKRVGSGFGQISQIEVEAQALPTPLAFVAPTAEGDLELLRPSHWLPARYWSLIYPQLPALRSRPKPHPTGFPHIGQRAWSRASGCGKESRWECV